MIKESQIINFNSEDFRKKMVFAENFRIFLWGNNPGKFWVIGLILSFGSSLHFWGLKKIPVALWILED